jgi:5-methyltetrahydropteroyltriglutamate--homocysteine methyltransferase
MSGDWRKFIIMSKVKVFVHGIYPRSGELIQISRDVLRKRRKETEYFTQYKKDCDNFLKLQQSLDFDFIEDGKLGWHDIFRPIVESTKGFEIGALTRWFDNNCFFRQPILTGKLQLDEKKLEKFFLKIIPSKKWKVTLPSPFAFAKLTQNDTNLSFEKVLAEITRVIAQIVVYLEQKGVAFVQFNEPYLPYQGATPADLKHFNKTHEQLARVKGRLIIAFQFYFGDAAPIIKGLRKSDFIDIIGVDFYKTALLSLPKDFPYALAAGVLDGRNSLLEDEDTLKEFVEEAIKTVRSNDLYITNNSDFELLPETIARKKVELLAKVRDSF